MIEGIELIIYTDDGKNVLLDLTPTQTEVIFKALGIRVDSEKDEISAITDAGLKKHILPRLNLVEIK